MGKLDQTSPGSLDTNPVNNQDLLGIENLGIKYDTLDLKKMSEEEVKNIQADIQDELDNPGIDLNERIHTILKSYNIKTIVIQNNKTIEGLGTTTTNTREGLGFKNKEIHGAIANANDAIKAIAPGLVESLTKDIKLTDLTEQQKNLLATQQGTTPEKIDLTSPATQSLIEVFAIDKNRDQIRERAIKNGKSAQEVQDIFTTWGMKMNEYQIPVSGSIDSSLKGIPKKIAESVKSTYQEIVGDKTPPTVTRTGDRLTFSDPRNERYSYEIDMSKQPPQLAKTLGGLSISRDVVGLSPEQKEKKAAYESAKGKLDKGEQKYSQGINEFWGARRGEYTLTGTSVEKGEDGTATKKDINIYSSIFLSENRWKQNQYEMIEQELATGNLTSENRGGKLETMMQLTRDMKSTNLEQMLDTGETENHSKINTMLEQRYEKITQLQKANQEIVEAKTEVSKNPQNTENQYNNFDTTAQDNLSWLVENRFDRMGPNSNKALQQIISSINKDNPSSTIDLTRPMEQRDHDRLIASLEKLGGTTDVLTNGDKLPGFQQRITMAASKNLADPNSIRGLLTKLEAPLSSPV